MKLKKDTVRIQANTSLGYAIINVDEFNPKIHQLYEDKPEPEPEPEVQKRSYRKKKESTSDTEIDLSDPDLL